MEKFPFFQFFWAEKNNIEYNIKTNRVATSLVETYKEFFGKNLDPSFFKNVLVSSLYFEPICTYENPKNKS